MKKNNKGFTLIETLIVSTFVATTLTYLFIQMNNTITNYDITFRYDTINDIYNADVISGYLKENGYLNLINLLSTDGYVDISTSSNVNGNSTYYNLIIDKTNIKTILFTSEDMLQIKNNIKNSSYSEELKRYILKRDNDTSLTNNYILIVEFKDNTFSTIRIGWYNE